MPTIVVDNGGCFCRAGWAGDGAEVSPSVVAPNAVAFQRGASH